MFHIISNDGITVTESGKKTLFIPKTHEEYDNIVKNINNIDYWYIHDLIDEKSYLQTLISDKIETYFNENEELEFQLSDLKENHKEDLKHLLISYINSNFENQSQLERSIRLVEKLDVSSIKIVLT